MSDRPPRHAALSVAFASGGCVVAAVLVIMCWYLIPLLVDVFREDIIPALIWPDFGGWLLAGIVGAYVIGTAAWWSANRLLADPLERQAAFVALMWLKSSSVALTCAAWIMAAVLGSHSMPSGPATSASASRADVLIGFFYVLIALLFAHVFCVMGRFRKRSAPCPTRHAASLDRRFNADFDADLWVRKGAGQHR